MGQGQGKHRKQGHKKNAQKKAAETSSPIDAKEVKVTPSVQTTEASPLLIYAQEVEVPPSMLTTEDQKQEEEFKSSPPIVESSSTAAVEAIPQPAQAIKDPVPVQEEAKPSENTQSSATLGANEVPGSSASETKDEAKENKHEQDEVAETEKPHEENPEAVRESIGEDAANAGQAIAEAAAEAREELENTSKEAEDKPKPPTEINPEESVLPDTEAKSENNAKNSEDTNEYDL